jgi:hypothetical protein
MPLSPGGVASARPYNRAVSTLRRHRVFTVLFALCSLLFMQLAVAGYSCPGFEMRVMEISAMAKAGMPCAESMSMAPDDEQPNLCSAHCQSAQSASGDYALQVPVLAAVGGVGASLSLLSLAPAGLAPEAPLLARATPPPIAVRHCCFRI